MARKASETENARPAIQLRAILPAPATAPPRHRWQPHVKSRLNDETGKVERVGGVSYVVKDGIVYDALRLLANVAPMVTKSRETVSSSSK
jgi:hypothetical protein